MFRENLAGNEETVPSMDRPRRVGPLCRCIRNRAIARDVGKDDTMTMRGTGNNRISPVTGKLTTNGRTSDGQKTKIVTNRADQRTDTYWGGRGKPDGAGHGHQWDNKRDGQTGVRKPR